MIFDITTTFHADWTRDRPVGRIESEIQLLDYFLGWRRGLSNLPKYNVAGFFLFLNHQYHDWPHVAVLKCRMSFSCWSLVSLDSKHWAEPLSRSKFHVVAKLALIVSTHALPTPEKVAAVVSRHFILLRSKSLDWASGSTNCWYFRTAAPKA